jgi:hypothetical protein
MFTAKVFRVPNVLGLVVAPCFAILFHRCDIPFVRKRELYSVIISLNVQSPFLSFRKRFTAEIQTTVIGEILSRLSKREEKAKR